MWLEVLVTKVVSRQQKVATFIEHDTPLDDLLPAWTNFKSRLSFEQSFQTALPASKPFFLDKRNFMLFYFFRSFCVAVQLRLFQYLIVVRDPSNNLYKLKTYLISVLIISVVFKLKRNIPKYVYIRTFHYTLYKQSKIAL